MEAATEKASSRGKGAQVTGGVRENAGRRRAGGQSSGRTETELHLP